MKSTGWPHDVGKYYNRKDTDQSLLGQSIVYSMRYVTGIKFAYSSDELDSTNSYWGEGAMIGLRAFIVAATAVAYSGAASAVTLVQTSDPGFYNDSIGTALNSTNGGEGGPFPISNDANLNFPVAPDLSAAGAALGNWLTDPLNLNANWSFEPAIPNNWAVGTEVAVIYQFDTLGATNVSASFGVDNGIFAWLDGVYLGGARRGGGVSLGEHIFAVGDLAAGSHFLQLLLEDHGAANGYAVLITADTFIPGLPPASVPEPGTFSLLGLGLAAIGYRLRRRNRR